jgi:hypothetical protein
LLEMRREQEEKIAKSQLRQKAWNAKRLAREQRGQRELARLEAEAEVELSDLKEQKKTSLDLWLQQKNAEARQKKREERWRMEVMLEKRRLQQEEKEQAEAAAKEQQEQRLIAHRRKVAARASGSALAAVREKTLHRHVHHHMHYHVDEGEGPQTRASSAPRLRPSEENTTTLPERPQSSVAAMQTRPGSAVTLQGPPLSKPAAFQNERRVRPTSAGPGARRPKSAGPAPRLPQFASKLQQMADTFAKDSAARSSALQAKRERPKSAYAR